MYCRNCNTQLNTQASACTNCGLRPLDGTNYCPNCGGDTADKAVICVKCGVALTTSNAKSKIVAGILALALGGLGVHKFYMGKPIMGILYICFSWTFIPVILGIIEGIQYLTMSDQAFEAL
ncbi:MAG: NINE protein [Caldilineaceae bacterium]|nr:NINE protein [Caldilineaceae bacterium]MCB0095002.1 NINE protein [Caldilineaceae bacterium]MCB0139225.1 NINE protein [Caldilineaceae bacterium]